MTMTPAQVKAIESMAPAISVIAGAGSGKTRVMVEHVRRLLEKGAFPEEILVLTFTRKAGNELKDRLLQLPHMDPHTVRRIWCGTFHAISYRILRQYGAQIGYKNNEDEQITIVSPEDAEMVWKMAVAAYGKKIPVRELENARLEYAHRGTQPEDLDFKRIFSDYRSRLRECNALDFDLLLLEVFRLFDQYPPALEYFRVRFKYVLVDEYQDTDTVQYNLHERIGPQHLFAVGDPRQSIYSFRGAEVSIIENFQKDHPGGELLHLAECFRCGKPIVKAANKLIAHNGPFEPMVPMIEDGKTEVYPGGPLEIAQFLDNKTTDNWNQIAVIARTHRVLQNVEMFLTRKGIPVNRIGKATAGLEDSYEWKNIHRLLKLAANKYDSIAFLAARKTLGITDEALEEIRHLAIANGECLRDSFRRFVFPPGEGVFWQTIFGNLFDREDIANLPVLTAIQGIYLSLPLLYSKEFDAQLAEYIRSAGMEDATVKNWLEWVATRDIHSELEKKETPNAVTLITAHASKGLEWEWVILAGFDEGLFPSRGEINEERRLAYVAMTRARARLTVFTEKRPSRFIEEAEL
jgi:DNA helicase-2/ATP-dependent DNA helicase PcrA